MVDANAAQRRGGVLASALSLLVTAVVLIACDPVVTSPGSAESPAGTLPVTSGPLDTPAPVTPSRDGSPSTTDGAPRTPTTDERWQYLPDFPAEHAIEVSSVVGRGGGFVAVGFEPTLGEDFGGTRNGVVWTSDDGQTWTRDVPAVFQNVALLHIASLDDVLYVFGEYSICPAFSDDCEDAPDAGIVAWRSADGTDWQTLAVPDSMRNALLDGVTVGLRHVIAYGATGDDLLGMIWSSVDGEQWSEVVDLAGLDSIGGLGAGPDRLVAFSGRYLSAEDDVETLAAHSDGGGLQPGQLPAGQRGLVESIAWGPSGFVAVGEAFQPTAEEILAVALVSADGVAWTAAPASSLPANASFRHVLAVPGGYLVIGSEPSEEEFGRERASAWYSADGLHWREHGDLAGGQYRQLSSSAVVASGVIVFATEFDEVDDEEPPDPGTGSVHAWFAPPEALP